MIALIVMTDGRRDCIEKSIATFGLLDGPITRRVIHDDSGDADNHRWLAETFPEFELVTTPGRSGFACAYRSARAWLRKNTTEPFIFSTEDDFTIQQPIPLDTMRHLLDMHPELLQLALRRQAWSPEEVAAGGVVERNPEQFTDRHNVGLAAPWLAHRAFFTTNSSLFRRSLLDVEWPEGAQSEGRFTIALRERFPDGVFGYWGERESAPAIHHIGHERVGVGY